MHFEPSKELKQFINECVESGWYQNQSEVMRAALRLMKRDEEARRGSVKQPNSETLAAFEEVEGGKAKTSTFSNFKKEMAELTND